MRFYGAVGYGVEVETRPGLPETVIKEVMARGDVDRLAISLEDDAKVNPDIRTTHALRLMLSPDLREHFATLKYVTWQGVRWSISTVEAIPPRILVRLGGVYNGRIAAEPATPVGRTS